jgi:pyruvate kinase
MASHGRGNRRRAKIVCTLGPASSDWETIADLASAGMAVARLNASHGDLETRRRLVARVREVEEELDVPLAVLHDLAGPEIRTANVETPVELEEGSSVEFVAGESVSRGLIGLSESVSAADPGDSILVDDGRIEGVVTEVEEDEVTARIDSGGQLGSRAGVNVPGVDLGLPPVTEEDRAELQLAAELDVDYVAGSFVRRAEDVLAISSELEEQGADIPVIAKIERAEAVENVEGIIEAADGIMVARGDLGVEWPLEDVPLVQKRTIRQSQRAGVPVITATEMLDSMIHERRPTRAEASDVANAVLDGTDALMLSGETAVGDHPVEVVETMDSIVRDVEASPEYAEIREQRVPAADETRTDALARSARFLARDVGATAIVAATESGYTARKAAKYRPDVPIVATTPDKGVRRELALSWGITALYVPYTDDGADAVIQNAVQATLDAGAAETGDTLVVLSGMMTELEGMDTANTLKVHVAAERLASGRPVVKGNVTAPIYRVGDGNLSGLPERVILAFPDEFDGEVSGDLDRIAGIVDGHEGVTGYAAIVARELEVPTICGVEISGEVADGTAVRMDAERGVLYRAPDDKGER